MTPPSAPAAPAAPAPATLAPAPSPAPSAPAAPTGGGFAGFLEREYAQPAEQPGTPSQPEQIEQPEGIGERPDVSTYREPEEGGQPQLLGDDVPLTEEEWQQYEAQIFGAPPLEENFDPASLNLDEVAQDPQRLRSVTERLLNERATPALQVGQTILQSLGDRHEQLAPVMAQVVSDMLNPAGVFDYQGQQLTNGQRLGAYLNKNFPQAAEAITLDTLQYEPAFVQQNFDALVERLSQEPAFAERFVARAEVQPYINSDLVDRSAEFLRAVPQELHETFRNLKPAVQENLLYQDPRVAIEELVEKKELADIKANQQRQQQQQQQAVEARQERQALQSAHKAQLGLYDQLVADAKANGYSDLEAAGIAAQAWRQIEEGYFDEGNSWQQLTDDLQRAYRKGDQDTAKKILNKFKEATVPLYKQTLRKNLRPSQVRSRLRPAAPPAAPNANAPRFDPAQPPGGPRGTVGQPITFKDYLDNTVFGR